MKLIDKDHFNLIAPGRGNPAKELKIFGMKKFAFYKDYDSRVWNFTGHEFDANVHIDNNKEQYTWACLNEKQLSKAYAEEGVPEPGYGYVIKKDNTVRQVSY